MPRYSSIKEEKLLKIWCTSDLEISSTFWENTVHFYIGNGAEIRPPKTALKNPRIVYCMMLRSWSALSQIFHNNEFKIH